MWVTGERHLKKNLVIQYGALLATVFPMQALSMPTSGARQAITEPDALQDRDKRMG